MTYLETYFNSYARILSDFSKDYSTYGLWKHIAEVSTEMGYKYKKSDFTASHQHAGKIFKEHGASYEPPCDAKYREVLDTVIEIAADLPEVVTEDILRVRRSRFDNRKPRIAHTQQVSVPLAQPKPMRVSSVSQKLQQLERELQKTKEEFVISTLKEALETCVDVAGAKTVKGLFDAHGIPETFAQMLFSS